MKKNRLILNLSPNFACQTHDHVKIRQLLFFVCFALTVLGQGISKKEWFPIERSIKGFRTQFVYKRQLLENPLALQIPLMEMLDPEISREFLTYKRQQNHIKWISSGTLALSLYSLLQKDAVSDGFYWSFVGTSALANVYFGSMSLRHFNRALNRYNELGKEQKTNISLQISTSGNQPAVGIAMKYPF
jgi:hypothetical protein